MVRIPTTFSSRLSIIFLLIAGFIFQLEAQPPDLSSKLPIDPSVVSGRLENGLKFYLKKNGKPENRAELRLAVHAGSLQEEEEQRGLAHFVEHMAFNGTTNFAKNELIDYFELTGNRFGADINAYTSFEETVYMLQTRTDSLELLEKGLFILEEWAGELTFDPEEIDKERGVVVSEWRNRLSPQQRLEQKTIPVVYKDSRYAERFPIGKPEIIENAAYATIKRFYEEWYRPDLMAVVAVGDFDMAWMEKEIRARFSDLQNPDNPRERRDYGIPMHEETRFVIETDKENSFTTIQLSMKHPETRVRTTGDYRTNLLHSLYNRMLNARLIEYRQQPDPPFTFAYTGYGGDLGDLDSYSISAFVAEGGVLRGLSAVYRETLRAMRHGFVATELERAKAETLLSAERAFKEADKTQSGRLIYGLVDHFLEGSPFLNAGQRLELIQSLLPTITMEDINPLAKGWIRETARTIVINGPEKEGSELPTENEILATLDSLEALDLDPYLDEVSDAPLLEAQLGMAGITAEKTWPELGVTEWALSNGIKVVMKPTDFQNDRILVSAFSPGGHSQYSNADYYNASYAAGIIDDSGIGSFSLTELNKKLSGKDVGVGPYIGEMYEGLSGSSSPSDLETLFELIYLYFTSPRRDEEVLQSFIAHQKSIMENILINPYNYYASEKQKLKYNNHPRRKAVPELSDLETLDLEKIYRIYQDRFADVSDFTFIFVGNFEPETLKPYLQKYLGSLPATGREETWKDVNADLTEGKIEKTWVRGAAPKALVEMVYHGDFEYTAENRYAFNSLTSLMRIKLREAMREDKGGVYGVSVRGFASQKPDPRYSVTISFNAEPEQVEDLITTAKSEIAKVMENGVEQADITKITETQRQDRTKSLKENGYWLGQLNARYQNDLPLDGITLEALEAHIKTLDSDVLQQAANRYFGTENFMQFVLLPEEQESEKGK